MGFIQSCFRISRLAVYGFSTGCLKAGPGDDVVVGRFGIHSVGCLGIPVDGYTLTGFLILEMTCMRRICKDQKAPVHWPEAGNEERPWSCQQTARSPTGRQLLVVFLGSVGMRFPLAVPPKILPERLLRCPGGVGWAVISSANDQPPPRPSRPAPPRPALLPSCAPPRLAPPVVCPGFGFDRSTRKHPIGLPGVWVGNGCSFHAAV